MWYSIKYSITFELDLCFRACFKILPKILCFNTMRYTFNMLTMMKEKVNTHFSFPLRLDMSGYMEENLISTDKLSSKSYPVPLFLQQTQQYVLPRTLFPSTNSAVRPYPVPFSFNKLCSKSYPVPLFLQQTQ